MADTLSLITSVILKCLFLGVGVLVRMVKCLRVVEVWGVVRIVVAVLVDVGGVVEAGKAAVLSTRGLVAE